MSLKLLNNKLGNIENSYDLLSQKYYLPEKNSKAINSEYLTYLCLEPIPICTIYRNEINPVNI